jgi:hypothetical protein
MGLQTAHELKKTELMCLGCNAVGAVTWEREDCTRGSWSHTNVVGDFHIDTRRAKRPLLVCTVCDQIYGPLPNQLQPLAKA